MALVRQKTGLLGGSFDPVHTAHIALAETAYLHLDLDVVQLIPAGNPWQRAPLAAAKHHRLAMLQLAAQQHPWLHINTIEIDRNGPTYTIDTLDTLVPGPQYYWILGADQLGNFCSWQAWQDIATRVHLVVAGRPCSSDAAPEPLRRHLQAIDRTLIHLPFSPRAVSASEIRKRLAQGLPADEFLDPAVAAYIRQHQLYSGDVTSQLTV